MQSNIQTREKPLQEVEIMGLENSKIRGKHNSHCGGNGHI